MVSSKASEAYFTAISNNEISKDTPLSFRRIAFKDNLQPIVDSYFKTNTIPVITVAKDGNVADDHPKL